MKTSKPRLDISRPSFSAAVQYWYEFQDGDRRSSQCQPHGKEQRYEGGEDDPHAICWAAIENAINALNLPKKSFAGVVREILVDFYKGDYNEDRIREANGDWAFMVLDLLTETRKAVAGELDRYNWFVPVEKANKKVTA
jgi:hypothetical protein